MSYKTKKYVKLVAIFLVGALACGLLLHLTGTDIKNPFKKDDVDNLITVDGNYVKSHDTSKGVKVDVDTETGEITLKGTASASHEMKVTDVTLKAGKYRISGLDTCDVNKFYMYASNGSTKLAYSGVDAAAAGELTDTFELTEETTVSVWLYWANEYEFGTIFTVKITPVIELVS